MLPLDYRAPLLLVASYDMQEATAGQFEPRTCREVHAALYQKQCHAVLLLGYVAFTLQQRAFNVILTYLKFHYLLRNFYV